jgi:membrane protease YdiL (CAAX protease family)
MNRAARRDIVEVVVVVAVIAVFLWFGRWAFPGVNAVFTAVMLAILLYSHRLAGESWRELGFRTDTFWSTSRLLLAVVAIAGVLIWIGSIVLRDAGSPPAGTPPSRLGQFLVLGLAQQYVMLGFIFKRVERVGGGRFSPAITALLFALLHLPNIFLTAVTFVWGVVSCLVYRRSPNLWANGLAHGLLAALVYYALPRSLTHALHVGMEYVARLPY